MGRADGLTPPQDPGRLPRLPRRHPRWTSHTATTMSTGEPDATEIGHVRFGGGVATRCRTMRVNSLIGGRRDVDSVVPGQCPKACSRPDVRHRQRWGSKHQGSRPRVPVPSGGYRQGKLTGRVNDTKPPMRPRHRKPRRWTAVLGCRTSRWEAAGGGCSPPISRVDTTVPG